MPTIWSWTARVVPDGVMFYPKSSGEAAGGPKVGGIRVSERQRPLEPVREIVASAVSTIEHLLADVKIGPVEQLVTLEGEYAASVVCTATSRADRGRVLCALGVVFGDEHYTKIFGYMTVPDRFDELKHLVRQTVLRSRLGLGLLRERRFRYQPPPHWQGLARGLTTEWYPADHPRHMSKIIVPCAFAGMRPPGSAATLALLYRKTQDFTITDTVADTELAIRDLAGKMNHVRGKYRDFPLTPYTEIQTVVLADSQYEYVARLETTAEWSAVDEKVLYDLVTSIRRLPGPSRESGGAAFDWMAE